MQIIGQNASKIINITPIILAPLMLFKCVKTFIYRCLTNMTNPQNKNALHALWSQIKVERVSSQLHHLNQKKKKKQQSESRSDAFGFGSEEKDFLLTAVCLCTDI